MELLNINLQIRLTQREYVAMFKRSKTDMQISIHYDFKGCRFKILLNIRRL